MEPMRLDAVVVAVILGVVRADCAFEVTELAHASCLRIVGGGTITMALVTVASGLPASFLRGLRRNRLRYVAAHPSTEYCEYNASLDASRPVAWTKVRALEQIFARARAPALAAWIDADASANHTPVCPSARAYACTWPAASLNLTKLRTRGQ